MSDPRDQIAKDFLEVARELTEASKHANIVSKRFSDRNVPSGCAHAAAVQGHIVAAQELINKFYLVHRKFAGTE